MVSKYIRNVIVFYNSFHKTLPKSSLQMHWASVRFYEMGDSILDGFPNWNSNTYIWWEWLDSIGKTVDKTGVLENSPYFCNSTWEPGFIL